MKLEHWKIWTWKLTDHKWTSVVLQVLVLVEDIDNRCQQRVQESKDTHSHEVLGSWGEVTFQENNLISVLFAQRSFKMHLLQSTKQKEQVYVEKRGKFVAAKLIG